VGPLESNKTYLGLIIARGATDAQSRMAQISFSTGILQSAYDTEKELERIKITVEAASIKAKNAAAAAEAINNAAAKATDAANAATDAANLASDAADNATAAAQEALYAANAASVELEEITKQVATLMAVLKAQIKTLADTVAKISKKVKG
jgi:hypothetical protein